MLDNDEVLSGLSITQIAAILGYTERNVARRLQLPTDHKLHIAAVQDPDGSYHISRTDLERHISSEQLRRYLERSDLLNAQLHALEKRVADLEQRVMDNESRFHVLTTPEPSDSQTEPLGRALHEPRYLIPADLPPGSMTIADFAQLHAFARRTLLAELTNPTNGLRHEAFPVPNRPDERNRYLTPEQQHAVIRFWRAHGRSFDECALCPHPPA